MCRNNFITLLAIVSAWLITGFHGDISAQEQTGTPAPDSAVVAPENASPPIDTTTLVFNEITLTEDGVSAVDTSSKDWYYDFKKDSFVEGVLPGEENIGVDKWLQPDEPSIEARCTEKREVQPFERSSVLIGYDEYVDGDIIAIGRVTVKGWVKGNVKSIYNRVLVTETGRVDGNIEAPRIKLKRGAVVLGDTVSTGTPLDLKDITRTFSADGLIVAIVFTVILIFFSFILVTLMPAQLAQFGACIRDHTLKAYLLGLLFILLLPLVILLFVITIVGILAVPIIPFVYLFAIIMGTISFGDKIGQIVSAKFIGGEHSMMFRSFVGVFLLMLLWIVVAILFGQKNEVAQGFGIALLVISILISTYPVCTGVGASLMTRFGFREYVSWRDRHKNWTGEMPSPAPPPLHDTPSIVHQQNKPPTRNYTEPNQNPPVD